MIISKGPVLNVAIAELKPPADVPRPSVNHATLDHTLDKTERAEILRALEESNWVIAGPNGAAARFGLKRSTLQARMQKLGIRVSRGPTD